MDSDDVTRRWSWVGEFGQEAGQEAGQTLKQIFSLSHSEPAVTSGSKLILLSLLALDEISLMMYSSRAALLPASSLIGRTPGLP